MFLAMVDRALAKKKCAVLGHVPVWTTDPVQCGRCWRRLYPKGKRTK